MEKELSLGTKLTPTFLILNQAIQVCIFEAFLAFMIRDFFVDMEEGNEKEYAISFYSGIFESAYWISQVLGCLVWDPLCKVIGRRQALILGTVLNLIGSLIIGLSKTYWIGVLGSFIGGFAGNVPVCKTFIREAADDKHIAKLYGYYGLGFGIGSVIGPFIGGYLSEPAEHYSFCEGVYTLEKYPYLVPMLAHVLVAILTIIVIWFMMPEVSTTKKKTSNLCRHLITKEYGMGCLINFLSGYMIFAYRLLVIVFSKANEDVGGLGWEDPINIGIVQGVSGSFLTIFLLWGLPELTSRLMIVGTYKLLSVLLFFGLLLLQMVNFFSGAVMWVFLLALTSFCYPQLMGFDILASIVLSNSVSPSVLGDANGITQAGIVLFRSLGNLSCGAFFGWSTTNDMGFPFDYHFMFLYLMLLTAVGGLIITFGFDRSVESRISRSLSDKLIPHHPN